MCADVRGCAGRSSEGWSGGGGEWTWGEWINGGGVVAGFLHFVSVCCVFWCAAHSYRDTIRGGSVRKKCTTIDTFHFLGISLAVHFRPPFLFFNLFYCANLSSNEFVSNTRSIRAFLSSLLHRPVSPSHSLPSGVPSTVSHAPHAS